MADLRVKEKPCDAAYGRVAAAGAVRPTARICA
jgi:hypothetical protein